jgi:hypothetical protein
MSEIIIAGLFLLMLVSNCLLWIELRAMQKSTHRVTYVDPFTQPGNKDRVAFKSGPLSEDETKELTKDVFDDTLQ